MTRQDLKTQKHKAHKKHAIKIILKKHLALLYWY